MGYHLKNVITHSLFYLVILPLGGCNKADNQLGKKEESMSLGSSSLILAKRKTPKSPWHCGLCQEKQGAYDPWFAVKNAQQIVKCCKECTKKQYFTPLKDKTDDEPDDEGNYYTRRSVKRCTNGSRVRSPKFLLSFWSLTKTHISCLKDRQ